MELENNGQIPHSHHKIPHSHHKIPQNTTQIPHHNDKKFFKCEYCNRDFSRIDSLNRHISKFCKKKQELDKSENENTQIIKKQNQIIKKQSNVKLIKRTNTRGLSSALIQGTLLSDAKYILLFIKILFF